MELHLSHLNQKPKGLDSLFFSFFLFFSFVLFSFLLFWFLSFSFFSFLSFFFSFLFFSPSLFSLSLLFFLPFRATIEKTKGHIIKHINNGCVKNILTEAANGADTVSVEVATKKIEEYFRDYFEVHLPILSLPFPSLLLTLSLSLPPSESFLRNPLFRTHLPPPPFLPLSLSLLFPLSSPLHYFSTTNC